MISWLGNRFARYLVKIGDKQRRTYGDNAPQLVPLRWMDELTTGRGPFVAVSEHGDHVKLSIIGDGPARLTGGDAQILAEWLLRAGSLRDD